MLPQNIFFTLNDAKSIIQNVPSFHNLSSLFMTSISPSQRLFVPLFEKDKNSDVADFCANPFLIKRECLIVEPNEFFRSSSLELIFTVGLLFFYNEKLSFENQNDSVAKLNYTWTIFDKSIYKLLYASSVPVLFNPIWPDVLSRHPIICPLP